MSKHQNATIQLAYQGAAALGNVGFEDCTKGLGFYQVTEALGPLVRGIDNERRKIFEPLANDEGKIPPKTAEYDSFVAAYSKVLETEADLPKLPAITVTGDDIKASGATGNQLGALMKIGVLRIAEPKAESEKPRAERRRDAKKSGPKAVPA